MQCIECCFLHFQIRSCLHSTVILPSGSHRNHITITFPQAGNLWEAWPAPSWWGHHYGCWLGNLGSVFDKHMTMESFVNSICAKCYCHLRRISSIRRYLTVDARRSAMVSLVLSTSDYCNALLAGQPRAQIARLQRLQNWAASLEM